MSSKSLIQLLILTIIFLIVGGVYFQYFSKEKILVDETSQQTETIINGNEEDKNKNASDILTSTIKKKIDIKKIVETEKDDFDNPIKMKNDNKSSKSKVLNNGTDIPNFVKDVEYLTTDKNENKYKILAVSGRTNQEDKNILDLNDVRGEITSDQRSTIYIVSDFAKYNSSTLASNFYNNVVINYEDKQIVCENFDINMDTNVAIAYNNVVVTDPKSTMKAGIITLNIDTKEIDINPDISENSKVIINTNE